MHYLIVGIAVLVIISVTVASVRGCAGDSDQSYEDKKTEELKKFNSDAQDR